MVQIEQSVVCVSVLKNNFWTFWRARSTWLCIKFERQGQRSKVTVTGGK